ncbi:hypothetical protein ACQJBY_004357 [Aegilops geniculata]
MEDQSLLGEKIVQAVFHLHLAMGAGAADLDHHPTTGTTDAVDLGLLLRQHGASHGCHGVGQREAGRPRVCQNQEREKRDGSLQARELPPGAADGLPGLAVGEGELLEDDAGGVGDEVGPGVTEPSAVAMVAGGRRPASGGMTDELRPAFAAWGGGVEMLNRTIRRDAGICKEGRRSPWCTD